MGKDKETFLIDTNSFLTPFNNYYPFDLMPKFWVQLKSELLIRNVVLLDMVRDEIMTVDDDLSRWLNHRLRSLVVSHKDARIVTIYSQILNYLQTVGFYTPRALAEWSKETVADPWLIGAAATYEYTIVTYEKTNGNLSTKNKTSRPKIPDVANAFDVKCENLFYMMRKLNFKF